MKTPRVRTLLWALALAAGTAAVFGPILSNGFVNWDDPGVIVDNPWLGRWDPAGGAWAFRSTLYGHFQPLAWLSLSLDKTLWGLDPGGFHLTSLLLHAAAAVLLFLLLRELLAARPGSELAAAASAALFAWHPLRVEAVAWATERRDGLMLVFLLLSALLYVRAAKRAPSRPRLEWAAVAFAAAALSKVFAAVFPFLLLVLDEAVLRRPVPWKRRAAEKAAFWAVAAAALLLGVRAQWLSGAAPSLRASGWADRFALAAWTPGWTLLKTLWPSDLTPLVYVDWRREGGRFWPVAAATALAAGAWVWSFRRRRPVFWLGLAWLAALGPALGLFRSGPQSSADRFTLLPSVVLSVGIAFLLQALGRRAALAGLALAVVLGGLARAQTRVWSDSVSLWSRAVAVGPANPLSVGSLASALRAAGREDEAEALYARLAAAAPGDPYALAVSADARYAVGDWAGAAELYSRALALSPDLPTVRVNYGLALYRLGKIPEAAGEFATAADADPKLPDAWHDLGIALARLGRPEEADRCLVKALLLDPSREDSRRARLQLAPLLRGAK